MNTLIGTGTFIRFFLRRDRFALFWWLLGGFLLYYSTVVSLDDLYPTQADLDKVAASMGDNAAFVAMLGPTYAIDTLGGQTAWQVAVFGSVLAGLMSMFLVGKHTRAEEESGRDELVRSGVVGRYAPLAAALFVVTLANVLLGAVIVAATAGSGLPVAGSVALGVEAAVVGLVFMAITLLAAQLVENTRAVYGIAGGAIAVSYVLRAVGDIGTGALSWLSPIGWGQAMHAFDDEVWWPALLCIAAAVAVSAVALRVLDHRDIGSGVYPPRPGPARAEAGMHGAWGLAWRLQRGTLIGWSIGLLLMGISYGSIGSDVDAIVGDSEGAGDVFAQAGGANLTDSFYATTALLMGIIAAAYTISAALRLRGEESASRVETLLSTRLSQWSWVASHVLIVVLGSAVVVGLGGVGTGITYALVADDMSELWQLFGASLVYLPAVWLLGGLTILLFGIASRLAGVGWIGLAFCLVVMMFGPILQLPDWLVDVSPFQHMPLLPVDSFEIVPVAVVTLIAIALGGLGFLAFRRRDLATG